MFERAVDLPAAAWDAVVVDEGQDFTFEAWFLVRQLASAGRLWVFHDAGQGFWTDRTVPSDLCQTKFKLPRGLRCPPGIAALAGLYLGEKVDESAMRAAVADGTLRLVACPDRARVADHVGAEVDRMLSEGISPEDIGIVSLRGQSAEGAVHHRERIGRHVFVAADALDMQDHLVADTFLRWKGLERPAIIVADVAPDGVERFGVRMHVALTRALVAARIVSAGSSHWPGLDHLVTGSPRP